MSAYLEVWKSSGPELVLMSGRRLTIGRSQESDVVLDSDRTVSRVQAILELVSDAWTIRDVGSRNGTKVNSDLILGERLLRPGDEIRIGNVKLVYRTDESAGQTVTDAAQGPPDLTRRERDVLFALCRPMLAASMLSEPASTRQIASDLVVTESAVKKHLLRLYDKFELYETENRRRGWLAHEAIRRGAVTLADLRPQTHRG
jgi:pSer/pThr/pTyr-binding forkhead associated (FHA) protein